MSVSRFQFRNKFTIYDAMGNAAGAVLLHPIEYVKILLQLGYEPFAPFETRTMFLRKRMALPGIFSYWSLIYSTDGFFGLFRGFTYKIGYTLTNQFVYINLTEALDQIDKHESPSNDVENKELAPVQTFEKLIIKLVKATACKVASMAVSYPFQVLLVRSCAQFIGKETVYNSWRSAIGDTYSNEGLRGFYAGFAPLIIGECVSLWLTHSVVFFVERYVLRSAVAYDPHTYLTTTTTFIVRTIMYPFNVISTVMAVNKCRSLPKSVLDPEFMNWGHCRSHLSQLKQLHRGSSLLFRYPPNGVIITPIHKNETDKSK